MGNINKADAIIQGIKGINALHRSGENYTIGLTVGDGDLVQTQELPTYNQGELTIHWDHTGFQAGNTVKGSIPVDFTNYTKDQMAAFKFTDTGGTQLKGGIVIKQTDYPPKAVAKKILKTLSHLNAQVSNALFLEELDLSYSGNNQWALMLKFKQPGNKYKLKTNGFSVITLGMDRVIQLHVETDNNGNNDLIIQGTVSSLDLLSSLPIILTESLLVSGQLYYKKGAVYIA